jgi:hypothetical protein
MTARSHRAEKRAPQCLFSLDVATCTGSAGIELVCAALHSTTVALDL